jgi:hypothetical protein
MFGVAPLSVVHLDDNVPSNTEEDGDDREHDESLAQRDSALVDFGTLHGCTVDFCGALTFGGKRVGSGIQPAGFGLQNIRSASSQNLRTMVNAHSSLSASTTAQRENGGSPSRSPEHHHGNSGARST